MVDGSDTAESFVNLSQAVVGGELGRVGHHAVGDGADFAVGQLEHGVAGPAEGGIDGEDAFGGHEG